MGSLEKSISIALTAHSGQKDKGEGHYILHPLRLMMKMDTEEEMIVSVLHDIIEDTDWTLASLKKEGFQDELLDAIEHLTRKKGESYDDFIRRVKHHPLACKIKLADLEDNMDVKRLKELTEQDLTRIKKYHKAWLLLRSSD
jgi:(p)ppGpp synthase/HD superfamily hydrolase